MDWIEFETNIGEKVLLRPEYIQSILQFGNHTMLYYEYIPFGSAQKEATSIIELSEHYEQVKQKIMNAERVDLSNVVLEHFTREKYKTLAYAMNCLNNNYAQDGLSNDADKCAEIERELNEILKEKENV